MNNNELYHYGVLGMKWGKRKARGSSKKSKKDNYHEDYKKAHSGKSYKSMSNQELGDTNKRLNMERQYKDLTKKTNAGKKAVNAFVATAGTISAVIGATAVYKKVGNSIIEKIGNSMPSVRF